MKDMTIAVSLGIEWRCYPRTWFVPMFSGTKPTKAKQKGCWRLL